MATLAELWQQYQSKQAPQYIDLSAPAPGEQREGGYNWVFNPDYQSQADFLFSQGYVSPDYLKGKNIGPIGPEQYLSRYLAPGATAIQDPNFGTIYQRPTWEQARAMGLPITDLMRFGQQQGTAGQYYNPALMGSDQATALGLSYGPANEGGGGLRGVLNENVDWIVPGALAVMGGYAAGGAAGLYGAEAGAGAGLGEGVGADAYFANAPAYGGAEAAATAASVAPQIGTPEWDIAQGYPPPADLPPQLPDWYGPDVLKTAGNAAAGTALSRILGNDPNNPATTADWVQVLGTAGATGLGMFSANQQANTLERLAAENRAERAPYLAASRGWLADPTSYIEGPGQAAMKGTLAGLSAKYGNPIGSPTAMAIANEAALRDWRDAVTGFGNMGLSGADTRANLGMAGAQATGNIYSNLAGGISDIVNPRRSLADLAREYNLSIGGVRV